MVRVEKKAVNQPRSALYLEIAQADEGVRKLSTALWTVSCVYTKQQVGFS